MENNQKTEDMKKVKGGAAFLVGWLGSWYIADELLGYDMSGYFYFFVGLFLYAIFSGAYSEEAEEARKAKQQKEQAQQADQGQ